MAPLLRVHVLLLASNVDCDPDAIRAAESHAIMIAFLISAYYC